MLYLANEIISLKEKNLYVILDIETTGGKFNEEGITEIAIHRFDGHRVVDQLITLVNPEKEIQEFVVKLTGINNKMLRNAPKFYEIAKRIIEITKDAVLVAHNANFDYRILRTEFDRLGYDFKMNSLCTVELSKKLIPNQDSYSLGRLCKSLGIPMTERHRANGDALATVQLFKLILEKDTDKTILQQSVKYFDNRKQKALFSKIIDSFPEEEGVFYLHDKEGKVIYIGKGKNIKAEVNNVFVKASTRMIKVQKRVHTANYEKTGNPLLTRLKYLLALDRLTPKYNHNKSIRPINKEFGSENMVLFEKGRELGENAIILVEKNEVLGYGFTNLSYQENDIEILKKIITPIKNKELAKTIVKGYLQRNKLQKIIRF